MSSERESDRKDGEGVTLFLRRPQPFLPLPPSWRLTRALSGAAERGRERKKENESARRGTQGHRERGDRE